MTDKSKIPLPAVTADSGPFKISDSKNGLNYCVYPNKKTKGVLSVPLDDRPDHLAIRLHEYGHLQLISSGFHTWDLPKIAYNKKDVDNSWFQSSLDVIVNAFLTRQGCEEITNLPLLIPNKKWPVAVIAQAFLRSAGLQVESKIKSRVSKILPKEDIEFLRNTATKLNDYSLQTRLPIREFFLLIRKLIKRFGKSWDDNNSKNWGSLEGTDFLEEIGDDELPSKDIETSLNATSESELNDLLNDKTKLKSVVKKYLHKQDMPYLNKWGKMEIANLPLIEANPTRKNARKIRPGFVGAFRYPHRALLPASDGMAFAHRKKAKGGTILLDCSGSMGLSLRNITNLLDHAPMLTVAGYSDDKKSCASGSLAIFIKNGMIADRISVKEWYEIRGTGNVIDGPAIRWLIKQARPRIWISDGIVTGVNDEPSKNLDLEIMLLKRIGAIKQYKTISDCLKAFKTKFAEIDY